MRKESLVTCIAVAWASSSTVLADGHNPVGWNTTSSLPLPLWEIDPVSYDGRIYVIGGSETPEGDMACYQASINSDGSLGPWVSTTPLPLHGAAVPGTTVVDGRIFISLHNDDGDVYSAAILDNGDLSWRQESSLPDPYRGFRLMVEAYEGSLYAFGGFHFGFFGDMYMATIGDEGILSEWTNIGSMPEPRHHTSVHFFNDRVYLAGGIGSGNTLLDSTYSAPVNADGTIGAWQEELPLPTALWLHSSQLLDGAIWVFGGRLTYTGGETTSIYRSLIDPASGSLGAWEHMGDLPSVFAGGPGTVFAPILGGRTYLVGGHNAALGLTNSAFTSGSSCAADIDGDGSIGTTDFLDLLANWGPCP